MTTIKSAVVGIRFHPGALDRLIETPEGASVELVRDPENKYDPNAVAVHVDGLICGFVPRAQAQGIAADMDAGRTVTATLHGHSALEITIEKEEETA